MKLERIVSSDQTRKISNREAALGAVAWSTISVATILVALTGSRQDRQEINPDDRSFEPVKERQVNSLQLEKALFADDFILNSSPTPAPTPTHEKIDTQEEVLGVIQAYPERFSSQDLEDVSMYYPIYQAAAEKYDLDWYVLWIIHKEESTCSFSVRAFEGGHEHYGAMQRALSWYSNADVDAASQGFEYLSSLPQRHFDDWQEIVWAASKFKADADNAQSQGMENPTLQAFIAYSRDDVAYRRWGTYQNYREVFA